MKDIARHMLRSVVLHNRGCCCQLQPYPDDPMVNKASRRYNSLLRLRAPIAAFPRKKALFVTFQKDGKSARSSGSRDFQRAEYFIFSRRSHVYWRSWNCKSMACGSTPVINRFAHPLEDWICFMEDSDMLIVPLLSG